MKIDEVPQDPRDTKQDGNMSKLVYAVDKDGKYTGVNSKGWEPENFALKQAWDDIEEAMAEVEKKVRSGELSPIAYYMHKSLMDITILASYVGKWQWQVKRHFKPSVFKSMGPALLDKYARIFNISTQELINFGKDKQAGK